MRKESEPCAGLCREYAVSFSTVQHGRRKMEQRTARASRPQPVGRVPRVARMLALAHHFDRLIAQGVVKDYAEIARLTQLSRASCANCSDCTIGIRACCRW